MVTEESGPRPDIFDPITPQKLRDLERRLGRRHGVMIRKILLARPGDPEYIRSEFPQKAIRRYGSLEIATIVIGKFDLILNHGRLAADRGFPLEGKLTHFAAALDGEITYYSMKNENVLWMAERYALKHEGRERKFRTMDEAKSYLRKLAAHYFWHEAAHCLWERAPEEMRKHWQRYIYEERREIVDRVEEIQRDHRSRLLKDEIAEEAFADMAIEVLTGETSRLGKNRWEANFLIRDMLKSAGAKGFAFDFCHLLRPLLKKLAPFRARLDSFSWYLENGEPRIAGEE